MAHEQPTRTIVGGLSLTALSRKGWTDLFLANLAANSDRQGRPVFMTSANGQVLSLAARNAQFRRLLDLADGIDADGMPLVIASRFVGSTPLPERVATTDFFHDLAALAARRRLTFFMLGATPD